ncbi:MAG: hypothetical protein Q7K13_02385 [Polynucleobacter sp.]|uniref:hypothetical protein n=1 Tax=Polynucleobacter sp. TaxID=2029855 RepID=UPI002726E08E|nr:hypothetical protein [Polynucleobacter sp.]MDO8713312.1 hypothetical protein [Polynucleobacter sp.]
MSGLDYSKVLGSALVRRWGCKGVGDVPELILDKAALLTVGFRFDEFDYPKVVMIF